MSRWSWWPPTQRVGDGLADLLGFQHDVLPTEAEDEMALADEAGVPPNVPSIASKRTMELHGFGLNHEAASGIDEIRPTDLADPLLGEHVQPVDSEADGAKDRFHRVGCLRSGSPDYPDRSCSAGPRGKFSCFQQADRAYVARSQR